MWRGLVLLGLSLSSHFLLPASCMRSPIMFCKLATRWAGACGKLGHVRVTRRVAFVGGRSVRGVRAVAPDRLVSIEQHPPRPSARRSPGTRVRHHTPTATFGTRPGSEPAIHHGPTRVPNQLARADRSQAEQKAIQSHWSLCMPSRGCECDVNPARTGGWKVISPCPVKSFDKTTREYSP